MRPLRCVAAALLLIGSLTSRAAGAEVTRRDDAYHFAAYAGQPHDANYVEWWYFNLIDPAQGLRLALTYSVLDPGNVSGFGAASVTAIAYTPGANFTQTSTYPADSFYASDIQADVIVGGAPTTLSFVQVLGDDLYRIVGSTDGPHHVAWNLLYARQARPWLGANGEHVGIFPWEQMSWLQYMPGAAVLGDVEIDGTRYDIAGARGYHDHNWGEWLPFTVTWNWAQYFEPGLAFSIGDFRNSGAGVVSIDLLGWRATFDKTQYQIVHSGWTFDPVNASWLPTTTWLYAQNDQCTLIVRLRATATVPVLPPPEIPVPLVPVIDEQTATVDGSVWAKAAAGDWRLVRTFHGDGFNEYTAITVAQPR